MKATSTSRLMAHALLCVLFWLSISGAFPAIANEFATIKAEVPAPIVARCSEDPSCVVVGGTHMLEWQSSTPSKIVVVCIHGLGLCARAYKPLAQELSAFGIDGFAVNVRGFGPDRNQPELAKLNCVDTVDDVSKLLVSIHNEHPDYKVFLVGESMGGALAVRIGAEHPSLVDGIVCCAPAWKLLKMRRTAIKGVFELLLFPGSRAGPAGRAIMHQATTDPQLNEHWLADPSHKLKLSLKEATSFLKFISKTDSYAKRLDKPVLIIQGLGDHLVSPKAVAKLFRDIPSPNKTFLIDGKGEHLVLEEGRFSQPLVQNLLAWLKSIATCKSSPASVEAINVGELTPKESLLLLDLRRLSRAHL